MKIRTPRPTDLPTYPSKKESIMTTATLATVTVPANSIVQAPLAAGQSFGHWNFDFSDSAGTKATTQTADGSTVTSAVFSVAASAPGIATFTVTAVDANGAVLGVPVTTTATLPFTLLPTTFPSPTAANVTFS